jgi:hypothetical protein
VALAVVGALVFGIGFSGVAEAKATPRFCHVWTAESALAASARRGKPSAAWEGKVLLLGSRRRVAPGEKIYARLANFGSSRLFYGFGFLIERRTGAGWKVVPSSRQPYPKVRGRLKPGRAGPCYTFDVPDDLPTARYRFSTGVGKRGSTGREARKTVEFSVD